MSWGTLLRFDFILIIFISILSFACSGARTLSRDFSSRPAAGDNGSGGGSSPGAGEDPGPGANTVELSKLTTAYTLSTEHVHLSSGENTTVTINFASPATQSALIPYTVYGTHNADFSQMIPGPRAEILVAEGATSVSFDLTHPSTPSFSERSNLTLVLDDRSPNESRIVLSLYNNQLRSMDQISLAWNHGCGILEGKLYCWGDDPTGYGFLGLGVAQTKAPSPARVGNGSTWSKLAVSTSHSCAIDTGRLYCWGMDSSEQLGNGPGVAHQSAPTPIGGATNWTEVSVGPKNSCGIRSGELWCWGADSEGLVGNGAGVSDADSPERIGGLSNWSEISVGQRHVCGIESGRLYCWGADDYGQLGNGPGESPTEAPTEVGNTSWSKVAVSDFNTCAIRLGELWCWGNDSSGKVGNGQATTGVVETPERIGSSSTWSAIALGYGASCGIDAGALFCWGSNLLGAVGLGLEAGTAIFEPQQVGSLRNWSHVAMGFHAGCAIESGLYSCWGSNESMRIGQGEGILKNHTSASAFSQTAAWSELSSSDDYACGILEGKLYCWGDDQFGRLGNGPLKTAATLAPERIGESTTWSTVSTGDDHVCGINNGELYCWGRALLGKLGNGQTSGNIEAPVRIGSDSNWTQVSAARDHTCGIESGNLYCWGSDSGERLGNGTGTLNSTVPMQIGAAGGWTAVSTSSNHSCAINMSRLYCWGVDASGALGNGAGRVDAAQPEMVGLSTSWGQISTGTSHSCGIDNGALYCWGSDIFAQLGNGAGLSNADIPEQVGGSSQWTHIGAKEDHTCGIDGGRLYCWGRNNFGQIANGVVYNTDWEESPYRIGTESNWDGLSVGSRANFAQRGGRTYMWGESLMYLSFQKPSF